MFYHQEMESLRLEVEGLKQGLGKYDDQLKAVDEAIAGIEQQLKEMEEAAKVTKVFFCPKHNTNILSGFQTMNRPNLQSQQYVVILTRTQGFEGENSSCS